MNRSARKRILVTCIGLAVCFTGFSVRLLHVQVARHEHYSEIARDIHVIRRSLPSSRGSILDTNGQLLAGNEPVKDVIVDATIVKEPELLAGLLAEALKLDKSELHTNFTQEKYVKALQKLSRSRYLVVQRKVSQTVVDDILAKLAALNKDRRDWNKIRGVSFEQSARRIWPNQSLLCHILGYVNSNNFGMDGIEGSLNRVLQGVDGFRDIERTRAGVEVVSFRGEERAPRNGGNVRLTIDMRLQTIVEEELDAVVRRYRPKGATVIMMDPHTGRVLALANRPNFNPNKQDGVEELARLNRAVSAQCEPGSTFKIVTIAATLNEGTRSLTSMVNCENGYWAPWKLRDHHPYASLSVKDVLVRSSNIGVAKLATFMGREKFADYIHGFGFGYRTGITLPGEINGKIHPVSSWNDMSITRVPMGHEVAATPLQIVTAISAIANGGRLMTPQIVQEVTDEFGAVTESFPPLVVRQVVSPKVTRHVTEALVEVTGPKGTAKAAQVAGFSVAGKTGTAQKLENGHYTNDKSVCSFVGFMPAEAPVFALLVSVDEPREARHKAVGGLVAGPVFSRIAERTARCLRMEPTKLPPSPVMVAKAASKTGGAEMNRRKP
jgi:cell division protein FtsI (penicillin-binding protein 3)/stage V sporulation protein D (sporulation-specific penicillin-binding protein)